MRTTITAFHADDEGHWVAGLACGHAQHMRHDPPWRDRAWVLTEAGRTAAVGAVIDCTLCDRGVPVRRADRAT